MVERSFSSPLTPNNQSLRNKPLPEEIEYPASLELPPDLHLFVTVHTVHLKYVLGQSNPNSFKLQVGLLSLSVVGLTISTLAQLDAIGLGGVHFIALRTLALGWITARL